MGRAMPDSVSKIPSDIDKLLPTAEAVRDRTIRDSEEADIDCARRIARILASTSESEGDDFAVQVTTVRPNVIAALRRKGFSVSKVGFVTEGSVGDDRAYGISWRDRKAR